MSRRQVLSINEVEILSEIEGAIAVNAGPKDAKTCLEIQASKGWSRDKVLAALHALGKQGRLVVHQVQRPALDQTNRWVPAYTALPEKNRAPRTR